MAGGGQGGGGQGRAKAPAARMMGARIAWLAGTSGFAYPAWRGHFYPDDLPAQAMLAHYAERLPAVELNNTFHRMPSASVVAGWREATPPAFRFVVKASRRITHHARLVDAEGAAGHLASVLAGLGDKLGCVLFQLPPYLRKGAERLDAFLKAWPTELPAAVEFRHASWFDDEVAAILRHHGVALAVADGGKLPLPERLATVDWVYLRLRQPSYDAAGLAGWLERAAATGAKRGFAFFKHEDAGAGPRCAAEFLRLARAG